MSLNLILQNIYPCVKEVRQPLHFFQYRHSFFVILQNGKKSNRLILLYVVNLPERSDIDQGQRQNRQTGSEPQELKKKRRWIV